MEKRGNSHPLVAGGVILAISEILDYLPAFREKESPESRQITLPEVSVGLPLVQFFAVVAVTGVAPSLLHPANLSHSQDMRMESQPDRSRSFLRQIRERGSRCSLTMLLLSPFC